MATRVQDIEQRLWGAVDAKKETEMTHGEKLQRVCVMGAAPLLAAILVVGLLAIVRSGIVRASDGDLHGDVQFPLIVGTSVNPSGTNHDIYEIDVANDVSQTITTSIPVWGATYDAANDRVLFTSSGGNQLWEWSASGSLTNLGTLMDDVNGGPQRIDGLALSDGVLYGSHAGASPDDGIWTIDMDTLSATLALPIPDSISGIDADPNTGELYGVNDSMRSLVQIDVAGAIIRQVVGYPMGETDIDGLAISDDGRAYMVIDGPGSIYVYNLNTGSYEMPLTAPWTASDSFSGGAYIYAPPEPGIMVTKTVGLDPGACATTDVLHVDPPSADVTYCYTVQNTGNVTLTTHDVVDDKLGTLLSDFAFDLAPGNTLFITRTTQVTQSATNVVTWTASITGTPPITATATATATVTEDAALYWLPAIFRR